MAFQSGALDGTATVSSILDLLRAFAQSSGWTTQLAGTVHHFSRDECHVNLVAVTSTTINDDGNTGGNIPDHQIAGRLRATSAPHTAAEVTGSNQRVVSNDMTPPFANYWMFSGGPGDAPYIHLVVQKASGRFCHLSFGVLDKKGAAYTGGAFLFGMRYAWSFVNSAANQSSNGSNVAGSGHYTPLSSGGPTGYATYNLFTGGIDNNVIITDQSLTTFANGKLSPLYNTSMSINVFSSSSRWLNPFFHLGPFPLNGVTALMEAPVMRYSANQRLQYFGSVPGWRMCSMIGREEVETVTFGTDEYLIFPVKRFLPWNPEPIAEKIVTSGPYGYAIKKVA